MKKIQLELHKENNGCVLNSQDIYNFVGENTEEDIELAYYIDKYCQYLNYYIYNNKDMMIDDTEYVRLEAWLEGYNHGRKYKVKKVFGYIEITTDKYHIILPTPFVI